MGKRKVSALFGNKFYEFRKAIKSKQILQENINQDEVIRSLFLSFKIVEIVRKNKFFRKVTDLVKLKIFFENHNTFREM